MRVRAKSNLMWAPPRVGRPRLSRAGERSSRASTMRRPTTLGVTAYTTLPAATRCAATPRVIGRSRIPQPHKRWQARVPSACVRLSRVGSTVVSLQYSKAPLKGPAEHPRTGRGSALILALLPADIRSGEARRADSSIVIPANAGIHTKPRHKPTGWARNCPALDVDHPPSRVKMFRGGPAGASSGALMPARKMCRQISAFAGVMTCADRAAYLVPGL